MNEIEIRNSFIEYLVLNKNYPRNSFLKDVHLIDRAGPNNVDRYICDLVILDTDYDNYLALVDFKKSEKELLRINVSDYNLYLKVLNKPNLLFYFVSFDTENRLSIFIIENEKLKRINIIDFPNYSTLSSKGKADEKQSVNKLEEIIKESKSRRKNLLSATFTGGFISLLIGVAFSYLLIPNFFTTNKNLTVSQNCCDSLNIITKKINQRFLILESQLKLKDTTNVNIKKHEFISLMTRMNEFDKLIKNDPKNLLQIQDFNSQLLNMSEIIKKEREISDIKLDNLKDKFDLFVSITITTLFAIIGAFVTLVYNIIKKNVT